MGKAIQDLKIPIGEVLSSPTYRALETIKFAKLTNPKTFPELGDRGQSMQGVSDADGAWLKEKTTQTPKSGNTVVVTHNPNLTRAFPEITGVEDGEALVFRPSSEPAGKGAAVLIGRIKIAQWPGLKP
jgi:phosphohistidine phosphatase SixA